jgi:putative membrane protein
MRLSIAGERQGQASERELGGTNRRVEGFRWRIQEQSTMPRTLLLGTVAAASIALLAACNKTDDNQAPSPTPSPTAENTVNESPSAPGTNSETVSAVEDAVSGAVGTVTAATTTSTQGFIEAAAISDMYEVEAARIALERSQRADVKAFAQQMLDAHTATSTELKRIVGSENLNVTLPAAMDDRRRGMIDNLRGAAAADFDVRYIDQQEMAHNEASTLFQNYADNGDSAALKQFAAATVTKINQHLNHARQLDEADDNQPPPATQ